MSEKAGIYLARLAIVLNIIVLLILIVPQRPVELTLGYRAWIAFPIAIIGLFLLLISKFASKSEISKQNLFWIWTKKVINSLIALFILVVLLSFLPLVRKSLTLKDHYWEYSINKYTGGLDLAKPSNFFNPELGSILLYDKELVENKIRTTSSQNYWSEGRILTYHSDYLLCYLGLKFQGLSSKNILEHPKGKEIILGLLVAELNLPDWWTKVDWLKKDLKLSPEKNFNLGLINFQETNELAQILFKEREKLSKEEIFAFIYILGRHFGLLSQEQKSVLLQHWAKITSKEHHYANYNYFSAMSNILEKRENFIMFADPLAENGKLAVKIIFPNELPDKFKKYYQESLYRFISLCGYTPIEGDKLTITATIAPKDFDALAIEDITISERVVTKYTTGKKRNTAYQEKIRDIKRDYKDVSGRILSLILTIETKDEYIELVAPPCGMSLSEKTMTEAREIFEQTAKDKNEQFTLDFYLKYHVASPWQFGVIDWQYLDWDGMD
ncbi:MAG: hypothetical protein HY819_04750 [Acidobacteria bacterium]|nr:hypothetical protein [Acidobacteriota bacterium]